MEAQTVSLAERLGTAGILAAVLIGIMFVRERQFEKEREQWRQDLERAFGLVKGVNEQLSGVMSELAQTVESLKGWLEGRLR